MARTLPLTWMSPTARFAGRINFKPLKKLGGKSFWALLDQASSSAGNFLTNILLARQLARENFGTFGLILEAIFFLNALQSALVIYPMCVRGASCDKQTLSRYSTIALMLTVLLALPVLLTALIAGAVTGHLVLAAAASVALLAWQLQETLRRALHTHMRHYEAMWGDSISYIGQALCILALIPFGLISTERVLAIIALTSALAAMVQVVQVGLVRVSWREVLERGREFLSYGKFLAANNLTVVISTLGYSWIITYVHGTAAVAELYAILTMLKPISPLVNGIVTLIVPATARANEQEGPSAASRVAARFGWLGASMLMPYLIVMLAAPLTIMGLFFGKSSVYLGDANVLRMYIGQAALSYAVATVSAYFNAIHHSRLSLMAQLGNTAVSLVLGLPLAWIGGLNAAAAGTLIAVAAQLAMLLHFRTKVQLRIPKFEAADLHVKVREPQPVLRKAA